MSGLLADRRHAPCRLGRVLVLGLGKSGLAVARYLAERASARSCAVYVAAGAAGEDALGSLAEVGIPSDHVAGGDEGPCILAQRHGIDRFDLCIASPGIPPHAPLFRQAAQVSAELIGEVEFAWRESRSDSAWVAVTGTNGKTTTTACCAHVLSSCGLAARAVGNIGEVCLDAVAADDARVFVAEVSSYQLASTRLFTPQVVAMLGITPDHLAWHGGFQAYCEAKMSVLDRLCAVPGAVAVLDATNDVVRRRIRALAAQGDDQRGFSYVPVGTAEGIRDDMRARCGAENAAFVAADDALTVALGGAVHAYGTADGLQVKGTHNTLNALVCAAVAAALGCPDDAVADALRAFAPLEHRIEPCGLVGGVEVYNDSKATNVDAALKALAAFPGRRPVVMLGGFDKNTPLDDLVQGAHAHARAVVAFGAAGERFARAFERQAAQAPADFRVLRARDLAEALDAALRAAVPGDVVLLSPACSSFDEFASFEHRGRAFKQLVEARRAGEGRG
ncbi:UDP-N-acetylmuramoyl-L-alanine--D-glutamate ligase [Eggerthellaceae bacterium zg-1084]|uniref:UDP-N-acetylmuramoyl-L-alanine--D-glutamate ligase n=1 Tax=Berryella wangjianweii TaxID=2734634 RepID=UPI0015581F45|nr:UDP-N-acetylmuramoyl-L-alanine--D-glutamate ligase [Berryella wangjianweii]NPD31449.1 UDP-N-acetylmuramoyl-L-alanine--D-glutamate ligase [Berryella wangjianweii]